jgi:hypothetical protein
VVDASCVVAALVDDGTDYSGTAAGIAGSYNRRRRPGRDFECGHKRPQRQGLESLLDRLGGDPATLAAHYRRAMQLERDFLIAAHAAR